MSDYQVIVGNLGYGYTGNQLKPALENYAEYRRQSKANCGRVGGEDVTLLKDDEILLEHLGSNSQPPLESNL